MFSLFLLLTTVAAAGAFFEPIVALIALALENPQAVGALLGLLVPLLVSALKQPSLSASRRRALAYAASAIVGILTVISMGQFNLADLTSTLLITIAVSQATYAELWKPTGAAAAVEKATTLPSQKGAYVGTQAIVGNPGDTPEDLIAHWHANAKRNGLMLVGEVSVHTSYESNPDGVLVAEGRYR